jgi:hypothetical protein
MKKGVTYEKKGNEIVSKNYDECSKCYFRKYNNNSNDTIFSMLGEEIDKGYDRNIIYKGNKYK